MSLTHALTDHAAIALVNLQGLSIPGQGPRGLLLNTDSLVIGAMQSPEAYYYNVSLVTPNSSLVDLSEHTGFNVQPLWWCSNPNGLVPHSKGFYSIATSGMLADSLLQISADNDPVDAQFYSTIGGCPV